MASPWISSQRPPADHPWLGIAMLTAVPLLSLILIRLFWSGSSLWFLTVGIILLGAAAVIFLARRTHEQEYGRQTLAPETARLPLILTGIGVLFLAMLILPNFSGGGSDDDQLSQLQQRQQSSVAPRSEVSGVSRPPAAQPTAQTERRQSTTQQAAPTGGETYVVEAGDTLWDIAIRFDTTVEAIVEANGLENPTDLAIGQELIIPPPENAEGEETGAVEQPEVEALP